MKSCRGCEIEGRISLKPESDFVNPTSGKSYRNNWCVQCQNDHNKARSKGANGELISSLVTKALLGRKRKPNDTIETAAKELGKSVEWVKEERKRLTAEFLALDLEEKKVDEAIKELSGFDSNPAVVTAIIALVEQKKRIGQEKFRNRVLAEDGEKCVFTDDEVVTASHLNIPGAAYSMYGLSLRADLSRYWDHHDRTALRIVDGEIVFYRPGHDVHGKVARLSAEKKLAVIAELQLMEGRI